METYKVGQEVGIARASRYGMQSPCLGIVTKVNGYGHVTVKPLLSTNLMIFDKYGKQRGYSYGLNLVNPDYLRAEIESERIRRERKTTVTKLIQKLQNTYGYSGTVHMNSETKAELLALLQSIEVTE